MLVRNFTVACTLACSVLGVALAAGEPQFVTGGVGLEERSQMLASKPEYNVRMTFATRGSGEYRSDVQVEVTDRAGATAVQARDAGPLMFVNLAPGRYRVTATAADGQVQRRDLQVQAGRSKDLYFYWNEPATIVQ
ncbi:carboxypeptidase regulatory-like domain-containing protein [Massilia sp. SR12]